MQNLIGKILNKRYRVEEGIGQGGMAQVYKVWDQERTVHLALKLLREDLARDRIFLRRFQREARTLAELQHPNIVRFYGLEQEDLLAFMLMDYVDGTDLRTEIFRLNGTPMKPERILEILRPVCSALNYAHRRGLAHCDIKPANIMLNKLGQVFVADFGIARMTDTATTTMLGMGTPAYMSPEQIKGEDPTPQTDIYALGVILYEMLSGGERPFTGEQATVSGTTSEKVRWEQLNLKPPSLKRFVPNLSDGTEEVVLRCLEKEPEKRYQDVINVLNELTLALTGKTVEGEPEPKLQPVQEPKTQLKIEEESQRLQKEIEELKMQLAEAQLQAGRKKQIDEDKSVLQEEAVPESGKKQSTQKRKLPLWTWAVVGGSGLLILLLLVNSLGKDNRGGLAFAVSETPTLATIVTSTKKQNLTPTLTLTPENTQTQIPTITSTPTATLGIGSRSVSEKDGMVQVYVPAGEFEMGANADQGYMICLAHYNYCYRTSYEDEEPAHTVFLDAFWIDQTEVTNAMYAICVADGYCNEPEDEYYGNLDFVDHPVSFVSWYDAETYCKWAGRALPSEAQWEKAARGTDGRVYPWGDMKPSCMLTQYENCDGDTIEVGSLLGGQSYYGALDMAGNVSEWVADWYDESYYEKTFLINPDGPENGQFRVIKGGSYTTYEFRGYLRCASRGRSIPMGLWGSTGFRCASSAH